MKNTLIKDFRFYLAVSKLSRPIADATHDIDAIAFYVVEVECQDGTVGQGYLLAFEYSPNAIEGALRDMKTYLKSHPYHVYETQQLIIDYEKESEYFGNVGINQWSLACTNIAMWDAWAKINHMPIYKMFGCHNKKIPVYGSGGWLNYTEQELLDEVLDYKKRGFTAVKVKVGSPDMQRDIDRLHKVKEAVGDGVRVMMDANQGMDVPAAIKLISAVEDLGIFWFEEPVKNTNYDGYKTIHSCSRISLAMGEREYNTIPLRELIKREAIDLWQPDIVRIGGVERWKESASLAGSYGIPMLPHYYKDYDVPLLTTISNFYGAESFDWIDGIIDNTLPVEGGFATPRTGDGWGFSFLHQYMKEVQ